MVEEAKNKGAKCILGEIYSAKQRLNVTVCHRLD